MTVLEPVIAWLLTCELQEVTLRQVMTGADRPKRPVLRVMDRLVTEGYLEEIEDNKIPCRYGECGRHRRNPTWKILGKPLSIPDSKAKRQTVRDKIWKMVRAKRRFTIGDMERLIGSPYDTIRLYLNMLERDGYIRRTGRDGHQIVWLLTRGHNQVERPVTKEKVDE